MRLTKKDKTNEIEPKDIYFIDEKTNDFSDNNQHLANQKLGQLEDIEEELGIDLVTLFKALKYGIYLVETDVLTKNTKVVKTKVDELHYWGVKNYRFWIDEYSTDINIIGYGETWALTKEELL